MTDKSLPEFVNKRRRRNLLLYTTFALLSYQLPVGVAYLAKFFEVAKYNYSVISNCYFSYLACSISALIMIRLKNQVTKKFIYFVLYFQVFVCLLISAYMIYVMSDQRYLVSIGILAILIFVFMQSTLIVSLLTILFTVVMYLTMSYLGIFFGEQPGSFLGEVLYMMIFVPVCIFNALMSKRMQDQQKNIKIANSELKTTHVQLEAHNDQMMESIRYAEMIQRSLLPGIERIKSVSPDSMFIWMPKDIVGGDIFYTYADPAGSLIALMDCTGHGVPGAFLTMIVYSEVRKIIMEDACREPSEILKRLNRAVKNVLHSHGDSNANDGLDAAVCIIDHSDKKVTYAGARIPLFYYKDGTLHRENGDKQSIGYKDSDEHFQFTNHTIDVDGTCSFYMKTDGFTDQLGGERRRRFGTDRFKKLITENHDMPYSEQRKIFLKDLMEHQADIEQVDDITLIGFHL